MLFLPSIIYQIVLLCHFEYKKIYDKDCFLSKLHLLFNHGLYGIAIHRGWVHGWAPSPLPGFESSQLTKQPSFSHLFIFSPRPSSIKAPFKIQSWKAFFSSSAAASAQLYSTHSAWRAKHHFLPLSADQSISAFIFSDPSRLNIFGATEIFLSRRVVTAWPGPAIRTAHRDCCHPGHLWPSCT